MKTYKLEDMTNGWFIGDFDPCVLKTSEVEVAYHKHKKNCKTKNHYHKKTTEINVVIRGNVIVNGVQFSQGDIFVIEKFEVSEAKFLEDTEMVVVRLPSMKDDKYETL
jgi:quercetin dioxygenase-like cupin family protein